MFSGQGGRRIQPFVLTCPWLGEVRSCNSPAGCKFFRLVGRLQFSCLHFPIPLAQLLTLLPRCDSVLHASELFQCFRVFWDSRLLGSAKEDIQGQCTFIQGLHPDHSQVHHPAWVSRPPLCQGEPEPGDRVESKSRTLAL